MKNMRLPSVPLVTCDPYFSLWSPADRLYEADTCHWTGKKKRITGKIEIDGKLFRFMGTGKEEPLLQTDLLINPTSSVYIMEGAGIQLKITFLTPLILTDIELVSRPASYIDWEITALDLRQHHIRLFWEFGEEICHNTEEQEAMIGGIHRTQDFCTAWMGKESQALLGHTGDDISIDWGYFYLAASNESPVQMNWKSSCAKGEKSSLRANYDFILCENRYSDSLVLAYDDIVSVMYFGDMLKGYWARNGWTIMDVLLRAIKDHRILVEQCKLFDLRIMKKAEETISAEYAILCAAAYRQTVAAHKLVADLDGNILFFSKECDSNGCIGTVDVSYPSIPLFLMFETEYVKGMMRPALKFSRMPVWECEFAPHDVGRYPHANGQVYGLKDEFAPRHPNNGKVFPLYYLYPRGSDIYRFDMQMPVEECGNMLIMAAAVSEQDGNVEFISSYMDLMEKWAGYLLTYGEDPGEQLCTDDFAGHWAHNANLAAKAIMGIEAYARILTMSDRKEESVWYHEKAKLLAKQWEIKAKSGNHTVLAFGSDGTWSLKYNLIWDIIFDSHLFSRKLFKNEFLWYREKNNVYGVPLDNRENYTKSDWILWVTAFGENKEEQQTLILPLVKYLEETPTRNPFPDWYDTLSAKEVHFHNRTVQGGIFMPMYCKMQKEKSNGYK